MTQEEEKSEWTLDSIKIEFKKGFNFEHTIDRYEGIIKFSNGNKDSFTINIRPDMANDYLRLIADEVIKSSLQLADTINISINNQLQKNQ